MFLTSGGYVTLNSPDRQVADYVLYGSWIRQNRHGELG
jgi:hypothetical protein